MKYVERIVTVLSVLFAIVGRGWKGFRWVRGVGGGGGGGGETCSALPSQVTWMAQMVECRTQDPKT